MKKVALILTIAIMMVFAMAGCREGIPDETEDTKETSLSTEATETEPSDSLDTAEVPYMEILTEIDRNTTVDAPDSQVTAVQSAVKLLDWGTMTGLDPEEIRSGATAWMDNLDEDARSAFVKKLTLVDEAYQKLLGDGAEALLASAGCVNAAYPWSQVPVEPVEIVMEVAGLR